jgi:transcriptional regulator with XRE-family HTH domain
MDEVIFVTLSMAEKIRIILKRKKMTISELAAAIGTSNQNLSNKLARDNFSEQELHEIAKAFHCHYEGFFIFDDGEKI